MLTSSQVCFWRCGGVHHVNCAGSQRRLYLRMLDQGVVGGNPLQEGLALHLWLLV